MMSFPERLAALQPFWGTWYLDTLLGKGSYGQVYKIKKVDSLGKGYYAALKWLWIPQDSADIYVKQRQGYTLEQIDSEYADNAASLREEILVMKKLSGNSHIVDCEDFDLIRRQDEPGWDILIRMELLVSLPVHFSQGMTVGGVIDLGIDICDALTTCEKAGIIHRDIKPDNIFIAPSGNYKLGDFGVAKQMEQTATQMSRQGTPQYMAPEVYQGIAKPDHSVDIYSLGMVMHELLNRQRMPLVQLTDRIPTQSERASAFVARMNKVPVPPPIDGGLALKKVVCKACEFNPKKRYSSAIEMKAGLVAAKSSIKLNDELTANPVLGVGLNSGRSDFHRSSKIRKSSTQNANDNMLEHKETPKIDDKQLDATMVLTDDMLHPAKSTRQPAKSRRKAIIGLVSVLVVATMAILALLLINGDINGPDGPKESPSPFIQITSDLSTQNLVLENIHLPTIAVTPEPTNTPAIKDVATPTQIPTYTLTQKPTATPTPVSTVTSTPRSTATPTQAPTNTLTLKPTATPTQISTNTPVSTVDMGYKTISDIYDDSTLARIISNDEPLIIDDDITWQNNDPYYSEQELDCYAGNGCILLKGNGLQMLIINEKEAIIALKDQELHQYYTELNGCSENDGIYIWNVGFTDDKSGESFTTQLSYLPTGNNVVQIDILDIQYDLLRKIDSEEENSYGHEFIPGQVANLSIADKTLIWHFSIPTEYDFSFANVKDYCCIITKSLDTIDDNDEPYYLCLFQLLRFPTDVLTRQAAINVNTQMPISTSAHIPTVIPTEILSTITPTQTPTASPSPTQTISIQPDSTPTNQMQHSATYDLYHSDAPLLCYKATQKTQMYELSSLGGEKLISIPKGTIVFSSWSGHCVIRTSYLGNVGWVSTSDFAEIDPKTEIMEFEDEVIRYFVLKQLGRLTNIQIHINDASDTTNGICECGSANNGIAGSVRSCTKYTDEYLNLDVTLNEMWSIEALTIDSSFLKNGGIGGQWKNAKSEQYPKKYLDLRMCINLSQFVLNCNVPPAVDAAILADCPNLEEIEIRRSNIDNASNLYLLSELKSLKLVWANGNYNDAIFPESLEYLKIDGDAPVWKGKASTYSNAVNLMYLKNLRVLNLSNTMITDLFPLRLLAEKGLKVHISSSPGDGGVTITDFAPIGQPEGAIVFPNKDIESYIRSIVWIQDDDLHYSDVKGVTSLDLSGRKLSDISFLKYFTGLATLNLSSNRVKDISFLRGLTALEELDLSNNQISNIEPLVRLSKLTKLNLSDNSIQGIDVSMVQMISLDVLDISGNKLKVLPILPPNVTDLIIADNAISSIEPIGSLGSLVRLDIGGNKVNDISCLAEFDYRIQADAYLAIGDRIHAAIIYRKAGMPMKSLEAFNLDGLIGTYDLMQDGEPLVAFCGLNGGIYVATHSQDESAKDFISAASKAHDISTLYLGCLWPVKAYSYYMFIGTNERVTWYNRGVVNGNGNSLRKVKQASLIWDCMLALRYDGHLDFIYNIKGNDPISNMHRDGTLVEFCKNLQTVEDIVQLPRFIETLYESYFPPYAMKSDGTIISIGKLCVLYPTSGMQGAFTMDITEIATGAQYFAIAPAGILYVDEMGHVKSTSSGVCDDFSTWDNVVAIYSTPEGYIYGLTKYGIVMCNDPQRAERVKSWTDIIALSVTSNIVVGLKSDGTVVTTNLAFDTSDWIVFD